MSETNEQIQVLVGKRIVRAEWTGSLPIDDNEGYLLTFDDGSQVLFSWYRAYDVTGVAHELNTSGISLSNRSYICETCGAIDMFLEDVCMECNHDRN